MDSQSDMKMKRVSVSIVFYLFFSVLSSYAQTSFLPVKNEQKTREEFSQKTTDVFSIKADFRQEKSISALSEKIISSGIFLFKKSNKLRLEYLKPFPYLMVMNSSKLLIKDSKKTTRTDLKSNKVFNQVNSIMTDCVSGNALNNKDFKTQILENATQYKLEMTPLSNGIKDFFKVIYIFIDKKDFTASKLELHELSGDYTIIKFSNKIINSNLQDDLFKTN